MEELLDARKVVVGRSEPALSRTLRHLAADGRLVAVLPGVYTRPPGVDLDARVRAVMAWDPDAVITGAVAARLSFWPPLRCPTVDVALRRRPRLQRPGYRFTERDIAPPLISDRAGLRLTIPALTALDLCTQLGGDAIDEALRTGAARLVDMERALAMTPARLGNAVRRELLDDSRDEPWSPPERRFHRVLRAAGLLGWRTNVEVRGDGWLHYIDAAFEAEQLAAEVDGRGHHTGAAAFERDHRRQNRLVRTGWTVLRFTPNMIDSAPDEVVETIQQTLCRLRVVNR